MIGMNRIEQDYMAAHQAAAIRKIHDLLTREGDQAQRQRNIGAAQAVAERAMNSDEVLGYGQLVNFKKFNV